MAYTTTNYKTKKAFKEAVASGVQVRLYTPGIGEVNKDGVEYVEGPHFPKPHTWYAQVRMEDGIVQSIK